MIITIKMHIYLVSQQVLSKNKKSEKLVKLCLHSSESVHISFQFDDFFFQFFPNLLGHFFKDYILLFPASIDFKSSVVADNSVVWAHDVLTNWRTIETKAIISLRFHCVFADAAEWVRWVLRESMVFLFPLILVSAIRGNVTLCYFIINVNLTGNSNNLTSRTAASW